METPITNEYIYRYKVGLGNKDFAEHGIWIDNVPEMKELVNQYRSILTTFSMNDFEMDLHITAGSAGAKFGKVHWENMIFTFYSDHFEIENLLEMFDDTISGIHSVWEGTINTYIHEFTHTVEMQYGEDTGVPLYGLHESGEYYSKKYGPVKSAYYYMCDYLINNFEVDGKKIGIPYEYWTGGHINTKNQIS